MSLTGYCYFHANDVTRDARGRFKTWGAARMLFKGGSLKFEMTMKGFEVDDDWAELLRADPELREALTNP
jgi:hypothetical protein